MTAGVIIRNLVKAIAGAVFLYGLAAVVLSLIPIKPPNVQCEVYEEIFVGSNGIHLYFILPASRAREVLHDVVDIPLSVDYVSFGWGDKEFYLDTPEWSDLKPRVALRALFTKSETAIHLTYHRAKWRDWKSVLICEDQMNDLSTYIYQSFDVSDGHVVELEHTGYSANDRFFEAAGNYTLFKTSNNWVNIGLKEAHVKTSVWSPFPFGVMFHLGTD